VNDLLNGGENGKIAGMKFATALNVVDEIKGKSLLKNLVWFRNNLRINDNKIINHAMLDSEELSFIYIFDKKWLDLNDWGFTNCSEHRQRFLSQGLDSLDNVLKKYGHQLNYYIGDPTQVLIDLVHKNQFDTIFCEDIHAYDEINQIEQLKKQKIKIELIWDSSLYCIDQLPFDITDLPDSFTAFRKKIESKKIIPNEPIGFNEDKLKKIKPCILNPYIYEEKFTADYQQSSFPLDQDRFKGGESQAHDFIKDYFKKELASSYKQTRNQLFGIDFSTKFSTWLAQGFISPRFIYQELKIYENEFVENESTYWIYFELLWRDYFRFLFIKHGQRLFHKQGLGLNKQKLQNNHSEGNFNQWKNGETSNNFINAGMHELKQTGFLSNRMRQIVASFLIYDLGCDWRAGAAWFESQLIDYDVYSNYGNWAYIAGVGTDPRGGRMFNIEKQRITYDRDSYYEKLWTNP